MYRAAFQGVAALLALLLSGTLTLADQTQVQSDRAKMFRQALEHAQSGNRTAQNLVGTLYQTGTGTAKNDTEAFRWYSEAASQDDAAAQVNLASLYMEGIGVVENDEKGVELLNRSAAQQFPLGIAQLGMAYLHGQGVKQDRTKGMSLIHEAAGLGDGLAAYELGVAALYGTDGPKDPVAAGKWFRTSAERGYPTGQYVYGKDYVTDSEERMEWYQRAANGGSNLAQYHLGAMYGDQTTARYDLDKAIYWYQMAALNGNEMGNQALFHLGLPDVDGQMPINDRVMSSSEPIQLDDHTIVTLFAAGLAIAIIGSASMDGDGSPPSDSSYDDDWEEPPLMCGWGEFDAGGFCMSYPDEWFE